MSDTTERLVSTVGIPAAILFLLGGALYRAMKWVAPRLDEALRSIIDEHLALLRESRAAVTELRAALKKHQDDHDRLFALMDEHQRDTRSVLGRLRAAKRGKDPE